MSNKTMKPTRQPARRAPIEGGGPSEHVSGAPAIPGDLSMIRWLLDPVRVRALRRKLINGTATDVEPVLWEIAYGPDVAADQEHPGLRFMRLAQYLAGEGNKPGPKYLNAPPGHPEDPPPNPRKMEATWGTVAAEVRRLARDLLEDPNYQAALRRRIRNGRAPVMHRLVFRWASQKPAKQAAIPRPKLSLCLVTDNLPWTEDSLAEREREMIERQEANERLERDRQAAAATPTPEEPDEERLELVTEP